MNSVAIQGQKASFHHVAAKKWFGGSIKIKPCDTLKTTFGSLENNHAGYAVVAIENSLYGSINETYDLLLQNHFWICGEVYLRIQQNLIGLPGTKLKDVREVHSHPVALMQCDDFLNTSLPGAERFEHHDTAGSVADVKKWNDKTKTAIAGEEAAKEHGLEIIAREIETNKQNYTRFVVLKKYKKAHETSSDANKTSIILTTSQDTKPGALYKALGAFARKGINLTLIHSRPVIGKAWHYLFYLDLETNAASKPYLEAQTELKKLGLGLKLLGTYKAGQRNIA